MFLFPDSYLVYLIYIQLISASASESLHLLFLLKKYITYMCACNPDPIVVLRSGLRERGQLIDPSHATMYKI